MKRIECIRPRAVLVFESGEKRFYASLESNASAKELKQKLNDGPLCVTLRASGSERICELPWELLMSDARIRVRPGDIILYNGNLLALYCGDSTRDFMSLTRIGSVSKEKMLGVLGDGDAAVSIYLEWSE